MRAFDPVAGPWGVARPAPRWHGAAAVRHDLRTALVRAAMPRLTHAISPAPRGPAGMRRCPRPRLLAEMPGPLDDVEGGAGDHLQPRHAQGGHKDRIIRAEDHVDRPSPAPQRLERGALARGGGGLRLCEWDAPCKAPRASLGAGVACDRRFTRALQRSRIGDGADGGAAHDRPARQVMARPRQPIGMVAASRQPRLPAPYAQRA